MILNSTPASFTPLESRRKTGVRQTKQSLAQMATIFSSLDRTYKKFLKNMFGTQKHSL